MEEGAEKLKTNQNLKLDEQTKWMTKKHTRMEAFDNLSSFFTFENKSISLS